MTQTAIEKKEITLAKAFSGFSVNDLQKAQDFYSPTLGLNVSNEGAGFGIRFEDGQKVFIYPKKDHKAATFTVLNFLVDDITEAVDKLSERGVRFEMYDGEAKTDEKGIFWGEKVDQGPNIAWFKDPAGNFLSVVEENEGKQND